MSLIGLLYEKAVLKRNEISKWLEKEDISQFKEEVKKLWNSCEISDVSPVSVAASDGSYNKVDFSGFTLYAVAGSSFFFDKDGKEKDSFSLVDVDLLKPNEYSETRLRFYMGILEIKSLLKLSLNTNPDLLLFDGSILGNIIRPVTFNFQIEKEERERVENELFPYIKENFSYDKIDSRDLSLKISRLFSKERYPVISGYLEYLEYLLSIKKLIEKYGSSLIALAKRSSSKIYNFETVLPDIFLFQLFAPSKGFSEPVDVNITSEEKFKFPSQFEFFRDFSLKVFYIKFKDNVYKVETTIAPEDVFNKLSYYIVNGYPYPLKKCHDFVKITNSDMEKVASLISLRYKNGREELGN